MEDGQAPDEDDEGSTHLRNVASSNGLNARPEVGACRSSARPPVVSSSANSNSRGPRKTHYVGRETPLEKEDQKDAGAANNEHDASNNQSDQADARKSRRIVPLLLPPRGVRRLNQSYSDEEKRHQVERVDQPEVVNIWNLPISDPLERNQSEKSANSHAEASINMFGMDQEHDRRAQDDDQERNKDFRRVGQPWTTHWDGEHDSR